MRTVIIHEGVEYRVLNHLHAFSACGRALKIKTLSPANIQKRPDGYLGVGRQTLLHRVIAECWVERPAGAKHVHHINGDKSDNRAANLEWLTPKEHARHHPEGRRAPMTEAGKEKLREYRTGRKTSEGTKQKQREATLRLGLVPPRPQPGFKHSEQSKAKMRLNSSNAAACEIAGVVYPSFLEAGKALGIKPGTLRKRCLSKSFSDYGLVED